LARLARALGFAPHPLGASVLAKREGIHVEELDSNTWLVTGPGAPRRHAVQISGPLARTHLVTRERAAYRHNQGVQRSLAGWLTKAQLARTLDALAIDCVLDVGANKGQFASGLRAAGYTGRIVSFEPLTEFVAHLEERSRGDDAWRVLPFALGEEDGQAEINVARGPLSSLLPSSEFGQAWNDKLQDTHPETIELRRLDSLYDDVVAGLDAPRVFLKLDTQGYDLHAFRGAGTRIKEILGLMSEVSCVPIYDGMPRLTEQLAEYEAGGFELAGMFPVTIHRASLRVIEFDAVMARPEAVVKP